MTGLGLPAVRPQMPRPRQPAGGLPKARGRTHTTALPFASLRDAAMTGLGLPAVRQPAGGRPPAASGSDLPAIRDALPRLSLDELLEIKEESERRYRELQSTSVVVDAREVSVTVTWAIRGWAAVASKRQALRSQTFSDGEHDWRMVVLPCGVGDSPDHVSVGLEVPDAHSLPKGWSREAEFTLTVKGRRRPDIVLSKKLRLFNADVTDWGCPDMVRKGGVDGYVEDDTLTIQVRVTQ